MVCNVGGIDRLVRFMAGVVLISFALIFIPTLLPKMVVLGIAVLLWASALFGVCYVYKILALSTAKQNSVASGS
jgi:hypothetical protein